MDGEGTQLHLVEIVTAPSLLLARRQPRRAGQLCWTRIWRIHYSGWDWRRTPAWALLNRVEGRNSGRTGPSRTMIQDVQLEGCHDYVPTDDSNGTISQRFVTLLYIRIESNRFHIDF
jgi:hypothetical protein